MPKITFIGAGSTIFAKNLIGDILLYPELADVTFALHDIDPERLQTSEVVAHKVAEATGTSPTIITTTDRRAALEGADYVIFMIQVGGYEPSTVVDFEIPAKYGLRQTIGDTSGIGGIMRGLRTIPVLIDICRDMEELCPDALLLNYVNPMVMNCWAIDRATSIKTVGLCHSVPYTAADLAEDIDVPIEEINYLVAGINHMAFYLKFERNGEDLYPRIQAFMEAREQDGKWPVRFPGYLDMTDHVRYEMFKRLGYFEYVPWFIKRDRPDLIEEFDIPLDEYIRRCKDQISEWKEMQVALEDRDKPLEVKRSIEYGSDIIRSMETGEPCLIYGNVPNRGLIDNLPEGVPVEVPCLVDKNGIQPTAIGALPPHLAALMQTNVNPIALTVEAALTQRRAHIYHAAMLDPHTAAELSLDQIAALVDELIEAHGDWLPAYE